MVHNKLLGVGEVGLGEQKEGAPKGKKKKLTKRDIQPSTTETKETLEAGEGGGNESKGGEKMKAPGII